MELTISSTNPNFGLRLSPGKADMRNRFIKAKKQGDAFYSLVRDAQTEDECRYIARRLWDPIFRFFSLDRNNAYNLAIQRLHGFALDKKQPELAIRFSEAKNLNDMLDLIKNASSAGECTYIADKITNNMKMGNCFEDFDENVIELARGKARIFSYMDERSDNTRAMVTSVLGKSLTELNFPREFDKEAFITWAEEMNLPEPIIDNVNATFYDVNGNILRKIRKDDKCDKIKSDVIMLHNDGHLMGWVANKYDNSFEIYINNETFELVKNKHWVSNKLMDERFLYPEIPYEHFDPNSKNTEAIRKEKELRKRECAES